MLFEEASMLNSIYTMITTIKYLYTSSKVFNTKLKTNELLY